MKAILLARALSRKQEKGFTINVIKNFQCEKMEAQNDDRDLSYITTSQFMIGDEYFGDMRLDLFDLSPELGDFDGILDMDFIREHPIYIDFSKKLLYSGNS